MSRHQVTWYDRNRLTKGTLVRKISSDIASLAKASVREADRYLGTLTSGSYHLAKLRSHLRFLRSLNKEPLLVYQMGKVGSSAVVSSLKARESTASVYSIYHVHWLTPDRLRHEERLYREAKKRYHGTYISRQRFHPGYIWVGQSLSKHIRNRRDEVKWKIVTLVRDPIARNVSSFFQNLETLLAYDFRRNPRSTTTEAVVADLEKLFLENYLEDRAIAKIDANPLTWFDSELKRTFDVDVFASEFPTRTGYEIYDTPRARVLLLRLEDLDRCAAAAFREFMQIENFTLVRANTGDSKVYSSIYEAFRRALTLPQRYMDDIYASKYSRHFYTEQELEAFRVKWGK